MPHRSHHYDPRGNTHDRRVRREWIMSPAAGFGGNGRTVPCYHCGSRLRKPTIDRYPICGHAGGRYVRGNIVPSCGRCNFRRGNKCKRGGCHAQAIVSEVARAA